MSRTIYITKGTELRFEEGIFTVDSINEGRLVYGALTIYGADGEIEESMEKHLTFSDIENELHRYDGLNHHVIWSNH